MSLGIGYVNLTALFKLLSISGDRTTRVHVVSDLTELPVASLGGEESGPPG